MQYARHWPLLLMLVHSSAVIDTRTGEMTLQQSRRRQETNGTVGSTKSLVVSVLVGESKGVHVEICSSIAIERGQLVLHLVLVNAACERLSHPNVIITFHSLLQVVDKKYSCKIRSSAKSHLIRVYREPLRTCTNEKIY